MQSNRSAKKNLEKKILIHASEAGAASFIKSIEHPLQDAGFKLFYDLYSKAKDILPSRPTGNIKDADLIICGYDRSEIDKTKEFIKRTGIVNCPKIGLLDTWRGIDRFWYENGETRILTDNLLVPDNLTKNYLIEKGLPDDWPIVIGHPAFDRANKKRKNKNLAFEESIKAKFNFKKEKKILLFLSEPLIFPDKSFQSLFSSQSKTNVSLREWIEIHYEKDFELMCRLHPIETNDIPDNWHDARDIDLDKLIDFSDLILGLASTPIAYSIASGKKVVNLEEILRDWNPKQSDMPEKYWEELKDSGIFSNLETNKRINLSNVSVSTNILNFINTQI